MPAPLRPVVVRVQALALLRTQ